MSLIPPNNIESESTIWDIQPVVDDIPISQGVVIAEKSIHKGWFFGAVSNGNAQLDLGNGKGIKVTIPHQGSPFVMIQIIDAGIGKQIRNQTWNRVKVERITETKKPKVDKTPIKSDVQMSITTEELL